MTKLAFGMTKGDDMEGPRISLDVVYFVLILMLLAALGFFIGSVIADCGSCKDVAMKYYNLGIHDTKNFLDATAKYHAECSGDLSCLDKKSDEYIGAVVDERLSMMEGE